MTQATWQGHVIAESDEVVSFDDYPYFPRQSVRMDLLHPSPRTPDDLT
jgi:uncharacterized protein (DUF427 family)